MKITLIALLSFIMTTVNHAYAQTNKLENTGNIGVGTTSPAQTIHAVVDDTYPLVLLEKTGTHTSMATYSFQAKSSLGMAQFGIDKYFNSTGAGLISSTAPGGLIFSGNNSNPHFNIQAAGNIGIGTTSPGTKLQINSHGAALALQKASAGTGSIYLDFRDHTGTPKGFFGYGSPGSEDFHIANFMNSPIHFYNYDGLKMSLTPSGRLGLSTSDPLEKIHVSDGRIFLQAPDPGYGNSTSGAVLRMGGMAYSAWYTGLGFTRGGGLDEYDMDFYTAYGTPGIKMKLTSHGRLGIGTNSPVTPLVVSNGAQGIEFSPDGAVNNQPYLRYYNRSTDQYLDVVNYAKDYYFWTSSSNSAALTIKDGKVGIGTGNPQSELAVKGHITAKKLIVTQTGWSDYVFNDDYKFPTLDEVEAFIKQHKHLPGVISAKEVEANGLDVGENQAVLLKKIEELTLYMIEMKKEIGTQNTEINRLKKQLAANPTKN